MNDIEKIELQLWDYIDGRCSAEEQSVIDGLINQNNVWREKYSELLEVHHLIDASELEHTSLRFTANVMDTIATLQMAPATKKYINNKIIWSIALFFIILIAGFVVYSIGQINWTAATEPSGLGFTNIDYSKMVNNNFVNVFMLANIILGLMLLDRLFTNKKKNWKEQL